jgi:hypothetical protein
MSAPRHLQGPLAALVLAIWILGGAVDLLGHTTVEHELCAEHGVVEHRSSSRALPPSTPLGPEATAADAPEGDHGDRCNCAPPPTVVVRSAHATAPPPAPWAMGPLLAATAPATPRLPLSYAPKTSPPA